MSNQAKRKEKEESELTQIREPITDNQQLTTDNR